MPSGTVGSLDAPHSHTKPRFMIDGHLRGASKIAYIDVTQHLGRPSGPPQREFLLRGQTQVLCCLGFPNRPWIEGAHRRSTASDRSPNTYHTSGTLLNRLLRTLTRYTLRRLLTCRSLYINSREHAGLDADRLTGGGLSNVSCFDQGSWYRKARQLLRLVTVCL